MVLVWQSGCALHRRCTMGMAAMRRARAGAAIVWSCRSEQDRIVGLPRDPGPWDLGPFSWLGALRIARTGGVAAGVAGSAIRSGSVGARRRRCRGRIDQGERTDWARFLALATHGGRRALQRGVQCPHIARLLEEVARSALDGFHRRRHIGPSSEKDDGDPEGAIVNRLLYRQSVEPGQPQVDDEYLRWGDIETLEEGAARRERRHRVSADGKDARQGAQDAGVVIDERYLPCTRLMLDWLCHGLSDRRWDPGSTPNGASLRGMRAPVCRVPMDAVIPVTNAVGPRPNTQRRDLSARPVTERAGRWHHRASPRSAAERAVAASVLYTMDAPFKPRES